MKPEEWYTRKQFERKGTDEDYRSLIPRCDSLDGSTLTIVPAYTEAGWFCEANCVVIRDEDGREAIYEPTAVRVRTVKEAQA